MARDEARIFAAIWQDEHFLSLSPTQQRLYLFLLSQPDLSYCGVIALRVRRWSKKARGLTVDQIEEDLVALAANPSAKGSGNPSANSSGNPVPGPLVIYDEDAEELFVRSLIRLDGIWKVPNLLKSAREAARLVQSPLIRRALVAELRRIPVEQSESVHVKKVMAEFIDEFSQGCGDPSAPVEAQAVEGPPNPSGKGSSNPSPNPSQGKGEGYGGKVKDSPIPGIPSPVPPSAGTAKPRPEVEATAGTIVAEWLDRCKKRPPGQVIGQIGKHVKAMLAEGIDPDDIRRGVAQWMTRNIAASHLPGVVNDVMNGLSNNNRDSPNSNKGHGDSGPDLPPQNYDDPRV